MFLQVITLEKKIKKVLVIFLANEITVNHCNHSNIYMSSSSILLDQNLIPLSDIRKLFCYASSGNKSTILASFHISVKKLCFCSHAENFLGLASFLHQPPPQITNLKYYFFTECQKQSYICRSPGIRLPIVLTECAMALDGVGVS